MDEHRPQGLGAPARRGALLGSVAQVFQQFLSVAATLVLARILHQSDFGIVAAANSILAVSAVILAMGINISVIRKPDLTQEFLSSIFWATVGLAVAVTALFVLGAPVAAGLFGIAEATPYVAVLAPVIALNVAATVPLGLLRRRLAFGRFWAIQVTAMAVYVVAEVALALLGFGAWAVIIGQLLLSAVQCGGAFVLARWSPSWTFKPAVLGEEAGFTGLMLSGHALNYVLKNADYWVVGRILGASALGTYYIAYVLPAVLRTRITGLVATVMIPVFSHAQDDLVATRRIYVETVRLQALVGLPAMAGVAVLAEPVILLFFGDRWAPAAEPLRWIALAAILEIIGSTPSHVAIARKWAGRVLASQMVRMVLFLPAVIAAGRFWETLEAVALAVLISTGGWCIAQQVLVARPCGLPVLLVIRSLGAVFASTGMMVLAVIAVEGLLQEAHAGVRLAGGVATGVLMYLACGILLFRRTFRPTLKKFFSILTAARSKVA